MKLDFNILWFENQFDDVQPAYRALRDHLADAGFELKVNHQSDGSAVDDLSREQEKYHEIDLILVDFDLGSASDTGDVIADHLRRRFSFTDIVFYSGKAPTELRAKINERNIDGVYCMPRPQLRLNLIELVDNLIKRMSRLEAMRGLAVASCSRADKLMREILQRIYDGLDATGREKIASFIDNEVEQSDDRIIKKYMKAGNFSEKLHSHACTSMILMKAAKEYVGAGNGLAAQRAILSSYQQQVIEVRNNLGHATEEKTGTGWAIRCNNGNAISRDQFPEIRQHLLTHLNNLEDIYKQLSGKA